MFNVNQDIVYENVGVCRVENIGKLDFAGSDHLYYTLRPYADKGGTIYVKVDTDKKMRDCISKDFAQKIINGEFEIETINSQTGRNADQYYMEIFKSCDCLKIIGMIKGLVAQQSKRFKEGKRLNAMDERTYQKARKLVEYELAVALGIDHDEVYNKMSMAS